MFEFIFICSFSFKQSHGMEHDIILLRKMISRKIFSFKKGSPDRGKTWESIQEFLDQMENPKFHIKKKRAVRDRWNILQGKFLKRMSEEEAARCIECEELSEKDTLIEALCLCYHWLSWGLTPRTPPGICLNDQTKTY